MGKIIAGKPYRIGVLFAVVVAAVLSLAAGSVLAAGALVDINTADQKTLESLPGVGPATAKEIVKGRPYKSVDDLANVKGIGKSKLEKIKPLVTVGGQPAAQAPAAAGAAAPAASPKATTATQPAQKAPAQAKPAAKATVPTGPVNLNTASKEQLEALPGIGPKKAQAIIDGRPYQKTEDIMKVKGIKQKTYDKLKDKITVQ
ncbi:MAG TPA: helix-hairpin-helix domain-containing protein [Nitrospirota bacterium]|nr:helix-hairpin-helix domain-containing protein [Nitrospirota bacterium]